MKVLFLGPKRDNLFEYFRKKGETIYHTENRIDPDFELLNSIDFIISYGYHFIIQEEIVKKFNKRIINLHISFLPWNRGADPNLWSFLDDSPKGVTIHFIDSGLDTGDIIVQQEITVYENDTLNITYNRLSKTIENLLIKYWPEIKTKKILGKPQSKSSGSFHNSRDKEQYLYLLTEGWNTPIKDIIGKAIGERENHEGN